MMATLFSLTRKASTLPIWGQPSGSAPAVYIVLKCRYFLLLVHRTFCLSIERRWNKWQPPPALDWRDWKQVTRSVSWYNSNFSSQLYFLA
jgi:hypothetical protein